MTKNEFLEGLRKALGNDLNRETVQENVAYYDGYINVQVNLGRTEEEVTADLGDPWVIAQTIIDAEEAKRGTGRNAGSSYTTANSGFSDPVYEDGGELYTQRIIMIRIRDIRHMCTHLALIHGGRSFC